jgi:anaerobic ribonucleoside-triphosphate reductase/transcriptional regulator NrdR
LELISIKCPYCSSRETRVIDKRITDPGINRRRRECLKCGKRFTTYERVAIKDLSVIKKDGGKEVFNREKLRTSILKACEKRPISYRVIDRIANKIERKIRNLSKNEVKTDLIGEMVMTELKPLDEVAYVRFASYYKQFTDVKSFEKELKKLNLLRRGKKITKIKKRDGKIVRFDQRRITDALWKAAQAVGGTDYELAKMLSDEVVGILKEKFTHKIPTVEDVQDIVEKVLVENGHAKTAKAYIIYREEHRKIRDMQQLLLNVGSVVDSYAKREDWRVRENANMGYSFSGLTWHVAGSVMAFYALNSVYPKEVAQAHVEGDFHLHDLSASITGYCAGWSLRQLIMEGYNGVSGRVQSKPPRHLRALLGQMMNFIGTLQHEWAGAQAFSSFDTYLAPFVRYDNLDYKELKQNIQEFVFNMNIGSRWGCQTPFSNITLDWRVPEDLKDDPVVVGGKLQDSVYGDYQEEMDMVNRALLDVLAEGDKDGRVFTFPIPTYNITKDFDWDSENTDLLFEMTGKYGLPYFQNFVNSHLKPTDVRAMCCRLQLDLQELRRKTGGLFGFGESTGSLGVVTINMSKIGYLSKNEDMFFERLGKIMTYAKNSLETKRKIINRNLERGLLPYTKRYLGHLNHHFSTIGLVGMNEACLNFFGQNIATKEGKVFAMKVLKFMRDKLVEFQNETGNIFNLEATPAEGASYRLARIDKKNYPNIITSGNGAPYYTNSTHLPVDYTDDIFEALKHQDDLQVLYTGGTVFHGFVGEKVDGGESVAILVKRISDNFHLPYFTISPIFSICPVHGYISGEHFHCPFPHSKEQIKKFGVKMGG